MNSCTERSLDVKIDFHFKFKYDAKLSSKENGSFKKGVLFATYSSLIGESQGKSKYGTRLSQIVKWCGSDFDGVVSLSIVKSTSQEANIVWVNTSLKWFGFVIGLLKQKSSLFVIRSLENQFL